MKFIFDWHYQIKSRCEIEAPDEGTAKMIAQQSIQQSIGVSTILLQGHHMETHLDVEKVQDGGENGVGKLTIPNRAQMRRVGRQRKA